MGLARFGQSEVRPPAPHISTPAVPQLVTAATLLASPQLPYFRFEFLQTLRRYSDPLLAVQPKTQELAFPDPPPPAFGGIPLQPQMLLDPDL